MIEFWAKAQGDKLAVDDGSKKLTYRELAHRASLYRTAARVLFSARSSAVLSFVNSKVAFYKNSERCISWRSCHDI